MSVGFEEGPRGLRKSRLVLSGLVALIVVAVALTAIWLKADGAFTASVPVRAELTDVGDGLPKNSDVKYRGVLVGAVRSVVPETADTPNVVEIDLDPARAAGIPSTVTARVVPSNLFAVSSVQLLDNGSAPAITSGAVIAEDESKDTVQFQTTLSQLRDIVAATGRERDDETIGLLAAVAAATDRRGTDIAAAGAQLDRITRELDAVLTPGAPSTLRALNTAVTGLRSSAPDLLDALHSSVVPMQTVVRESAALTTFLAAGSTTAGRVDEAMRNNVDQLLTITRTAAPVVDVVARGSSSFTGIVTEINVISEKWFTEFWPRGLQNGRGKFMFQFTPHRLYTRADCPRYGELEGPSCSTAPESVAPPVITKREGMTPGYRPAAMGGNVGSVGSADEQTQLAGLVGGPPVTTTLLLGPLARGSDITVSPAAHALPATTPPGPR
ncbi:MCE family protein [Gordonia sp. LSe1-13]|uniref:MCE family protein n=1 Tax=Gordonia sesuvii TaxID=3116777 RepID=A0ABU7M8I4_9ACTN|nr:MCE family protein [Gordonia sp. LSe1-13]